MWSLGLQFPLLISSCAGLPCCSVFLPYVYLSLSGWVRVCVSLCAVLPCCTVFFAWIYPALSGCLRVSFFLWKKILWYIVFLTRAYLVLLRDRLRSAWLNKKIYNTSGRSSLLSSWSYPDSSKRLQDSVSSFWQTLAYHPTPLQLEYQTLSHSIIILYS